MIYNHDTALGPLWPPYDLSVAFRSLGLLWLPSRASLGPEKWPNDGPRFRNIPNMAIVSDTSHIPNMISVVRWTFKAFQTDGASPDMGLSTNQAQDSGETL